MISLLGKIFGFIRELLLANYFGTSGLVDVYLMSITIPSILFGFLPALGVGFTPIYFEINEAGKKNQFLNNILTVSMFVALICICITIVFRNQIVAICAPGFNPYSKQLTARFLIITVWAVLFNTPVQILTAYLNCNGDYIKSNISNLSVSIVQAVFVVVAAKAGDVFLPIGVVTPWLFQLWWLGSSSRKKGYRFERYTRNDEYLRKMFKLVLPLFLSNVIVDINGFIDKLLASSLAEGRMSALNYAFTLRAVFVTASSTVIATIVYPKVSEKMICGDVEEAQSLIARYLDIIAFIIVPICFICCTFSQDIVRIVLMRGSFDQDSLMNTASPFLVYSLSLAVIVWRELIIKIMYSSGRTAINLKYSMIEIGINITLSLLLVRYLDHVGLAIATTIAVMLTFPLYIKELYRVIQLSIIKTCICNILKIVIASLISVLVSFVISRLYIFLIPNEYWIMDMIRLVISVGVGSALYLSITYILHVEESVEICAKAKEILMKQS